jgi:hypothetical protein
MKEQMKKEAFEQYLKEKEQVDKVINKMIEEDVKLIELTKIKQQQAKTDMILSVNEKKEMQRRRQELEAYENDMLKRFAEQQQMREDEIRERKAQIEAAREGIFQKLKEEEEMRRA